jgi:hypothetical protein
MQRCWRLSTEPLAIEESEIRAVLVLEHVLPILDKDAGMHTRYTALFSAMGSQVHIGVNVADSVLATDQNGVLAAYVELLIICLDDEPGA